MAAGSAREYSHSGAFITFSGKDHISDRTLISRIATNVARGDPCVTVAMPFVGRATFVKGKHHGHLQSLRTPLAARAAGCHWWLRAAVDALCWHTQRAGDWVRIVVNDTPQGHVLAELNANIGGPPWENNIFRGTGETAC